MNYLERYKNGEHELVWEELQALGAGVREEPILSLAREVAIETMGRVRRNCDLIISRLRSMNYTFGIYPDGTTGYYSEGAHQDPSAKLQKDYTRLESLFGPVPLSLEIFWQVVGSIDLVGKGPGWPGLLDPLVIDPPEGPLLTLVDIREDENEPNLGSPLKAPLAPDDLFKDNISGGSPYAVGLPSACADFIFLNERHGLLFVPYLRFSILRWGGFPGLDGKDLAFPPLKVLTEDLLPF